MTRYELRIFANGANPATATPLAISDLGKAAPAANGDITVDRAPFFSALAPGTYVAAVAAIGSGGTSTQHRVASRAELTARCYSPIHQHRPEILAIHPRDVGDRDFLRADRFALALVRAAAESLGSWRSTMLTTRPWRSTWPCGSSAEWLILADVNSAAEAFLQAATHAPHPMQAAASIACSATVFGIRMALPSWRATGVDRGIAARLDDRVERTAIDDQILDDRERLARQGSRSIVSPSLKRRMWSWQTVVPGSGPCGIPSTRKPQAPQMPSRQSESNAIASSPFAISPSLTDVQHLEERHVGGDASAV